MSNSSRKLTIEEQEANEQLLDAVAALQFARESPDSKSRDACIAILLRYIQLIKSKKLSAALTAKKGCLLATEGRS